MQTIGVVGLGLIGGSMAKTIQVRTQHTVLGFDANPKVVARALEDGTIDGALDATTLGRCDMVIVALYPQHTIAYVMDNLQNFAPNTVIFDCAGVKTGVCAALSQVCLQNGLRFVGGHPMAGIEQSGYAASFAHLFDGASMVLCHDAHTDRTALCAVENFVLLLGFGKVTLTTPEEHDRIIAFTSQLAHVVSNAYVQSPQAAQQMGFSAGSYKDLTRVAYLNEQMWSELFLENAQPLATEVRGLAQRLHQYADLIEQGERQALVDVLRRGKEMKQQVG